MSKKKHKKQKNILIPLIINDNKRENFFFTVLLTVIRIALLCLASVGVCCLMVQIYKIPIEEGLVIKTCVIWTVIFNLLFILLRYRYAIPLFLIVGACLLHGDINKIFADLKYLLDFFFLRLDSRLLYTSRFASVPVSHLENPSPSFKAGVIAGFCLVSIFICFIFSVFTRGRLIGSILITTMLIMIPAFGAEIASMTPALLPLILSLFGLFTVWASGNYYNYAETRKRGLPRFFGGLPKLHKYYLNAIPAILIAAFSFTVADKMLPNEKTIDLIAYFEEVALSIQEMFLNTVDDVKYNMSGINDSGYFPSNNISRSSLAITNPSTGTAPVLLVTYDDVSQPLYIRNGIGITYDGSRYTWDVSSDDSKVGELNTLLENYYPEHNYFIERQKINAYGLNGSNYIGIQQVQIKHLLKTRSVMIPTAPYLSGYKDNDKINWNIDTVLQWKKSVAKDEVKSWDVLYPMNSKDSIFGATYNSVTTFSFLLTLLKGFYQPEAIQDPEIMSQYNITGNIDDYILIRPSTEYFTYFNADVVNLGMTAAEYLEKTAEYERLVGEIYTQTDENESENMNRLYNELEQYLSEVKYNINYEYLVNDDGVPPAIYSAYNPNQYDYFNDKYFCAMLVRDYFKNNYLYSLDTDNKSGDNTMLGNFLFETKAGHCALYASAMTLFMREMGFPARYVTGYVVSGSKSSRNLEGKYECTVIERDLHAWVEVYFEGLGWLPFDPTPAISDSVFDNLNTGSDTTLISTEATDTTTTTMTTTTTTTDTSISRTRSSNTGTGTGTGTGDGEYEPGGDDEGEIKFEIPTYVIVIIVAVLVAVFLLLLFILFLKFLKKAETKLLRRFEEAQTPKVAAEMYTFILGLLRSTGITVNRGELPAEFASRAWEMLPDDIDVSFPLIMDILEKLEFSKEHLSEEEYLCLSIFTKSLYENLVIIKNPFKRFFLRILFVLR